MMIGKVRLEQQFKQEEERSTEETISEDQKIKRESTAIEIESEEELYGLALILRNTEDAAKKSRDLTGIPDKERSDDHESSRGEKTNEPSENI